ncbi:MAG: lipid-A-disaccharide synthase [Legionellaceae bacterium]|nr:lipid-A-disaccharide synthase [Legionellaceae bacterium]
MSHDKHIVIIAGEESGDQHAAHFVSQLKTAHPRWQFSGIGGQHLEKAGMKLLMNLARYGVTGAIEVLKHFAVIRTAFRCIKTHIKTTRPDLIILVDYPGFNLRLAQWIKRHSSIPILYFIGPQIWAWKAGRIHRIKANVDHMAVILPFEKAIYQQAGVPVSYVGHPLVERLTVNRKKMAIRASLQLPDNKKIIALLPGSRQNELAYHLPVLVSVMQKLHKDRSDICFVMPLAKSLDLKTVTSYLPNDSLPLQIFEQQAQELILASDAVIVASGTASLECALLGTPGCIIYKASPLTAMLAKRFINIPYLGLANIIQDELIMPELLQENCNAPAIVNIIQTLFRDEGYRQTMMTNMQALRKKLSAASADHSMQQLIENLLQEMTPGRLSAP